MEKLKLLVAKFFTVLAITCMVFTVPAYAGEIAKPTTVNVVINNSKYSMNGYSINDNNFVTLEDLAVAFNGKPKEFNVSTEAVTGNIIIQKNQTYSGTPTATPVSQEIKEAIPVSSYVFVDNVQVQILGYTIDGFSYFKLQDIMKLFDISIIWNNKIEASIIDTTASYNITLKPLSGIVICLDLGDGISSADKETLTRSTMKTSLFSATNEASLSKAEINLAVLQMLKQMLEYNGATIILTREDANANIAILLNCDTDASKDISGISMLVPGNAYLNQDLIGTSYYYGDTILNNVLQSTGAKSRGIITKTDLTAFNHSTIPVVLIEMGFMTNPQEYQLLSTFEYQQKIADGISTAILELFNPTTPAPDKSVMHRAQLQERALEYQELNPDISIEEALWKVAVDLDKAEFTEANLLTVEQLSNISVLVNKRNRVPDDYVPSDLENITGRVALRSEAKAAFDKMVNDASIEGYYIQPISGFRTVPYQNGLFNRYLKGDSFANVVRYSAKPGFSEHHTGLAIDVGANGRGMNSFGRSKEHTWVVDNGHKYGFIIRYLPNETNITGYISEPWHLRYVGTLIATKMKEEGIRTLEEYIGKYGFLDN